MRAHEAIPLASTQLQRFQIRARIVLEDIQANLGLAKSSKRSRKTQAAKEYPTLSMPYAEVFWRDN